MSFNNPNQNPFNNQNPNPFNNQNPNQNPFNKNPNPFNNPNQNPFNNQTLVNNPNINPLFNIFSPVYNVLNNTDSRGNDIKEIKNASVFQCKLLCNILPNCGGFGYDNIGRNSNITCYLKNKNMYPNGEKQQLQNFDIYYKTNLQNMTPKQINTYKNNYPDVAHLNNEQIVHHWNNIGKVQGRSNDSPPIQTVSGKYKYVGCYNDKNNRAIPKLMNHNGGNVKSVDECREYAEKNRQMVFGVQNGSQCFIGNNIDKAKEYGENYGENCGGALGGSWTNRVYVRGEPFIPPIPHLHNINFNAIHKTKQ